MAKLLVIPLASIRVNKVQFRDVDRDSEDYLSIVESVKDQGIINPINVREKPGDDGKQYELIDGLHRLTAAQDAGTGVKGEPGMMPVQVLDRDEQEALITQIIGNAHRIEPKPVEYAKAIMRVLAHNPTWTIVDLAGKLNKGPAWLDKQLGLLKLHDQIKPLVDEGKIILSNAHALAKLPKEEQLDWLERAQHKPAIEFTQAVTERAKQIRDANRKGQNAGEEQFVPVAHLRKKAELEAEANQPQLAPRLIQGVDLLSRVNGKQDAAVAGFQLGVQWALNLDPESIKKAKVEFEQRKEKKKQDKVRADAERAEKKRQEAEANAKKARDEAAKLDASKAPATEGEGASEEEPEAAGAPA